MQTSKHTPRLTKKSIREGFAPLSRALLKEGRPSAEAMIAGFKVKAVRQSNLHVCLGGMPGFVWNPLYIVDGIGSGARDQMEDAIYRRTSKSESR